MDRANKQPKLNCRNWECGVLLPICEPDKGDSGEGTRPGADNLSSYPNSGSKAPLNNTSDDIDIAQIFGDTVPVPMKVPGRAFGSTDRPWFYNEY